MPFPGQDEEFGQVTSGGEFARPESLNGHLLVIYPIGYVPHIQTQYSRPGERSDAVCCDVIDLDDKDELGNIGKVYRSSNFMQAQLIVSLRPFVGRKVLGIMGKGVGKVGRQAPWVIRDMSQDQESVARARAWSHANPGFGVSAFAAPLTYQGPGNQVAPATPAPPPAPPTVPAYSPDPVHPAPTPPSAPAQYAPPAQQYAPAAGSPPLSTEELDMLQWMRVERARREAEAQRQQQPDQFGDQPPF